MPPDPEDEPDTDPAEESATEESATEESATEESATEESEFDPAEEPDTESTEESEFDPAEEPDTEEFEFDPAEESATEPTGGSEFDPGSVGRPEAGTGVDYEVSDDEQTWGILAHAAAFAGLVVPFGNILGPLVVWLVKKDESRFVDENGKQSLNFQITWTILLFAAGLTILIGLGLLLVPLVGLAWLVLTVIGTIRASEREVYDYPLTIDLIS